MKIIIAIVVSLIVSACAKDPETQIVTKISDAPRAPMSAQCYAEANEKFKPIAKTSGNQTPVSAALHALQSNKSRMARNNKRALACECAIAEDSKNGDDLKRLEGQCPKPEPKQVSAAEARK